MARKSLKFSHYSKMLLNLILYSVFWEFVFAFSTRRDSRQSGSSEKPTSAAPNDQQVVRLHSGVIASVVVVVIGATAAAFFIIRKYCFPQSNATYRYSELQQMEEHNTAIDQEDSDEDLLE